MSFLNENEPLWSYLAEVLRDRGFLLFDARRRGGALDISVFPAEITPEHRSVSIDECGRICRELRTLLLVDGEKFGISGEDVEIDVSSPGINRTLRLRSHFDGAVGERVKLVIDDSLHDSSGRDSNGRDSLGNAQRVIIGKITATGGDFIEMQEELAGVAPKGRGNKKQQVDMVEESAPQRIPLERVRKANVEFDFSSI